MATKKISELEAINAAEDNDVLVIVDTSESTTNKITKGNLLIGAGHTIEMTLNENYQIVLVLKNAAGTALSTQTIDLPNENAVTNLAYNNGVLTITKQSGATSQINLTGLIEGLVTENDFNTFKEALQTTLEAINEKDAEQDEAIAENYKVINKLNEKLENQQKVINQLPQVEGQGTSITLENTIEAQFTKFDVEGNSVQDGTPSPDNEVPILSSGDNVNLFDGELELGTLGSTGTNNNSTTDIRSKNYVTVDEQETYTISSDKGSSASLRFYDTNKTFISTMTGASMPRTFETPENAKYVRFVISNTTDIDAKVKLEKSTQATPYSPYGMGSINEKIQNKNVLDYKEIFNNAEDYSSAFKIYRKKLQPNTSYTTSSNFPYTNKETGFIVVNSTDEPSTVNYGLRGEITTTTNSDGIICIYIRKFTEQQIVPKLENFESGTYYIQTEPGSTSSPYVPHEEQDYSIFVQQPFRSIGDARDLFFKNVKGSKYYNKDLEENKWYEMHYKRLTFDGTENWQFSTGSGVAGIYMLNPPIDDMVQGNFLDGLSNYFHNGKSGKGKNSIRFGANNNVIYIYVDSNEFPDKTSFTSWLAEKYANGTPLYIDYIPENPTYLPCTETQIQQLENKPSTYKDFTIIQSEDETPAYLEVSGIRDIDTMFDKVTNAIVSLGGNV